MQKDEPWQFERMIGGTRYVGLAWHKDKRWTMAIRALFVLKFEGDVWPSLPMRKIPAIEGREEMYLILIPDLLDTRMEFTKKEREIYTWLHNNMPGFLEGFNG